MRKTILAVTFGLGLLGGTIVPGVLGANTAYAGFRGGGGFHGGGGFYGGGGYRGDFGGFRGGYGGYRGYGGGGFGIGYIGGYGGYHGGFGGGYGCCGYGYGYGYDGAGFLLGAAAVAGVTALAIDSAYDRRSYRPSYDYGYTPPPPRYYDGAALDRSALIDRCARAAESDARGFSTYARFDRVDSFDRSGGFARVDGTVEVSSADRYDRDGTRPVRFSCSTDGGRIVDLRLDR